MKDINIQYQSFNFDLVFVGFGAANCLLILRLIEKGKLKGKSIGIIEPSKKNKNDRTFCFWSTKEELEELHLQTLVSHSWKKIKIGGVSEANIEPLKYWHIKGIDLYEETRGKLKKYNVQYINSHLISSECMKDDTFSLVTKNEKLIAKYVFDSRPPEYYLPKKNESHIYQSFYGWKITTNEQSFDSEKMVMMDFNVPQGEFTQFVYVLPFDSRNALIELTRFGIEKVTLKEANKLLKEYLKSISQNYTINEIEAGVIPMSSAQIKSHTFNENWKNMGARNNKVKCTTGFAFHEMAKEAKSISLSFPHFKMKQKSISRFAFYDRLLLKILVEKPEKGKLIFTTLFAKVPTISVLNFLQEKTSWFKDILLFSKLPKMIFIKMAVKDFIFQIKQRPIVILPLLFTLFSLLMYWLEASKPIIGILLLSFFTIGLSHGALDHLIKLKEISSSSIIKFSGRYIFKALLYGIIWSIFPDIALFGFLVYSAFHFGQADFKEWNINNRFGSIMWGFIVLSLILFFHPNELITILSQFPGFSNELIIQINQTNTLDLIQFLIVISGVFLGLRYKSKGIGLTLLYLVLCSFLPLLVSFGIYFTLQHSKNGWKHLKQGLGHSSKKLFLLSLPFTLLATFLIIVVFFSLKNTNQWAVFFIMLSCLSLPHVITMNHFYSKKKIKR